MYAYVCLCVGGLDLFDTCLVVEGRRFERLETITSSSKQENCLYHFKVVVAVVVVLWAMPPVVAGRVGDRSIDFYSLSFAV